MIPQREATIFETKGSVPEPTNICELAAGAQTRASYIGALSHSLQQSIVECRELASELPGGEVISEQGLRIYMILGLMIEQHEMLDGILEAIEVTARRSAS